MQRKVTTLAVVTEALKGSSEKQATDDVCDHTTNTNGSSFESLVLGVAEVDAVLTKLISCHSR